MPYLSKHSVFFFPFAFYSSQRFFFSYSIPVFSLIRVYGMVSHSTHTIACHLRPHCSHTHNQCVRRPRAHERSYRRCQCVLKISSYAGHSLRLLLHTRANTIFFFSVDSSEKFIKKPLTVNKVRNANVASRIEMRECICDCLMMHEKEHRA